MSAARHGVAVCRTAVIVGVWCAGASGALAADSSATGSATSAGLAYAAAETVQGVWRDGVSWLASASTEPTVLEQGSASFLANRFHGRPTASGERYDKNELTAAHKTLPFGTRVIVRSLQTGREVAVRIVDRGPHLKSRIIDLSHAAAEALGIRGHGVSEVQVIEPSSIKK